MKYFMWQLDQRFPNPMRYRDANGGNYGQRLDYTATFIPPAVFIPFDVRSQSNLKNGIMPFPLNYKYIKTGL